MSEVYRPEVEKAAQWLRDENWMREAIAVAKRGRGLGLRPFGAVIVDSYGEKVAGGFGTHTDEDPTRHSEMLAIRQAARRLRAPLHGCTLYSTHEPCLMCAGAIVHAQFDRVVYGSSRDDLPDLFRLRINRCGSVFSDCSRPIVVRQVTGPIHDACVALFDEELDALRFERESVA